jgi:hypothetical protein
LVRLRPARRQLERPIFFAAASSASFALQVSFQLSKLFGTFVQSRFESTDLFSQSFDLHKRAENTSPTGGRTDESISSLMTKLRLCTSLFDGRPPPGVRGDSSKVDPNQIGESEILDQLPPCIHGLRPRGDSGAFSDSSANICTPNSNIEPIRGL